MSDCCKLDLGSERFVQACAWKNEIGIDIREYERNATKTSIPRKKGIRLTVGCWNILVDSTENIDEALSKGSAVRLHLGGNIYCKVAENNVCVNIRQYWCPPDQDLRGYDECINGSIFSSKKGIFLRPAEYIILKEAMLSIGEAVLELNAIVPCFAQSDHQNQLGMLQCAE
jgi:hypothetical protein